MLLTSTNLIAATINVVIVVSVLLRARRKGLGFPPVLLVIVAYFLTRALDRLAAPDPFLGYRPAVDAATDIAAILLLITLFVVSGRIIDAILRSHDEALYQTSEYARARREYTQIIRHRLMNPLTVISGAALTLRELPDLDQAKRDELLMSIMVAAETIGEVSLAPEQAGREERGFSAVPKPPDGSS